MAISNGSTRQIRAGRSCHSYVINCPVELGRDSNWIDYRYASARTGDGGDGAVQAIHSISGPIGPKSWRRDWKNHPQSVITAGSRNYTLRKCPARRQKFIRTPHILARKHVPPLFPPTILFAWSFHLFTHNQCTFNADSDWKNERTLRDTFTLCPSIILARNSLGFITIVALRLTSYTTAQKYLAL